MVWLAQVARRVVLPLIVTLLLTGFLATLLMRLAPGFGIDQRELDARLSAGSVNAIRESHAADRNPVAFYFRWLSGVLRGDLGHSASLGQPVAQLLGDRAPVTARAMTAGLVLGWCFGLALALVVTGWPSTPLEAAAGFLGAVFLCVPSAVMALLLVFAGGATSQVLVAGGAISLIVFPRVFRYARGMLAQAAARPHVMTGRARGLSGARLLFLHILPPVVPSLLALAGVSVSLAFGASIPIEAICDLPGIGQLAWQAAQQRDLPLLANLTFLVAGVTVIANTLSGWVNGRPGEQAP